MSLLTLPHTLAGWLILLLIGGILIGGVAMVLTIRSIIRPISARTHKDYGTPQDAGLPASKMVLPNGCRGWWAESRDPEGSCAILLVHGRSRSTGWMYPLATKLWPQSTIMAIDLPGHGESPYALVTYGKHESETVTEAVQWLTEHQDRPIVIVGISMGGASVLLSQASTPSPRVRGIVTIGTYTDIASVFRQVAQQAGIPWSLAQWIFRCAGWVAGFDLRHHRPIDAVAKLHVPHLAIQGKYDHLVPLQSAERLAAADPSGRSSYATYNGPHDAPSNPALVPLIRSFLMSVMSHDAEHEK